MNTFRTVVRIAKPLNVLSKKKEALVEELKDKESRDAYMSESIDVGLAFQIRALREQREWSQTVLAEKANMHQERISALENPSRSPTLSTLKKLASAFDVGLIVRFVPFSEIVKWEFELSPKSLKVPGFTEEDYFKESQERESAAELLKSLYSEDVARQPGMQDNIIDVFILRREREQEIRKMILQKTGTEANHGTVIR